MEVAALLVSGVAMIATVGVYLVAADAQREARRSAEAAEKSAEAAEEANRRSATPTLAVACDGTLRGPGLEIRLTSDTDLDMLTIELVNDMLVKNESHFERLFVQSWDGQKLDDGRVRFKNVAAGSAVCFYAMWSPARHEMAGTLRARLRCVCRSGETEWVVPADTGEVPRKWAR